MSRFLGKVYASEFIGNLTGNASTASNAEVSTSVKDYGDTSKKINIGYNSNGITGDNIKFIAGYTTGTNGATANIKDVSKDALRSWLGAMPPASHTHNYAGSSSAGGSANSAVKLDSSAGSSSQPVYFSSGKPVACGYTINTSVPSGAKFTDTNTWRPLGTTADTACAGNDSRLSNARPASDVYAWAKASSKPSYSKSEVGLGNVDNTADSAKNVKYATSAGSANSVAWTNVSGRPSSMPASDVYSWAKASSKPSYSWNEISGKPGTFAPSGHNHTDLDTIGTVGYYGSDAANSSGWYKVYSTTLTNYNDHVARLSIVSGYNPIASGLLTLHLRCDNTTSIRVQQLIWETRQGFNADNVIINTNGNTWTLYLKITNSQYGRVKIRVLESMSTSGNWSMSISNNSTKESANPTATATAKDGATVSYANSAGSVAWSGISGKPALVGKTIKSLTAASSSGWSDLASAQNLIPDMSVFAYWNGAYGGTASNLAYCNRGAFGTIITKNAEDYATASHTHSIANITNLQTTLDSKANKQLNDLNGIITTKSITTAITPNTTAISASPFARDFWHDHFAFLNCHTIDLNQVSTDGTTWTDDTLDIKPLFQEKENDGVTFLSTNIKARRFILNCDNLAYSSIQWIELGVSYTNPFSDFSILVEKSKDKSAWTKIAEATISGNSVPYFISCTGPDNVKYFRFTFTKTTNQTTGSVRLTCIKGLSNRKGDQGLGIEYEYPYNWDYNRNIYPYKDNGQNLGNSSKRWANVYAVTFNGALSGNASTATALTSSAGSAESPIYFSSGKPATCSFSLLTQSEFNTAWSKG